ncbi:MAG: Dabb family protein, partial [Candidatus Scalindua sp.]
GRLIHSEREIVDSSFDVAIYLSFENEQKLFEYLNHPIHKEAVGKTLKPLVRKVIVCDFIE